MVNLEPGERLTIVTRTHILVCTIEHCRLTKQGAAEEDYAEKAENCCHCSVDEELPRSGA